jgi:acyl-CoA thioester hydrolase
MPDQGDKAARPAPLRLDEFLHCSPIQTRWADNDSYGHINNVVYYAYFDSAVNDYLIARGVLDLADGEVIGLVVETACHYFSPAAFPATLRAGLRVSYLGNSSVRYEIGIFREGQDTAIAQGHFVHVYVNRRTRRPVPLPSALRTVLEALLARPAS